MKTSELTGIALDWAVGTTGEYGVGFFSTDWAKGGLIIEREGISIGCHLDGAEWFAKNYWAEHEQSGSTPLIAAMRCYVASELGDEVEIPEELNV
jgi:hypothetical protein